MRTFIATIAAVMVSAYQGQLPLADMVQQNDLTDGSSKLKSLQEGRMNKQNLQPIELTLDGVKTTKYVLSKEGCTGQGADYVCPIGGRGYIYNSPNYDMSNPDFFMPSLLGGSIEWDIDLSLDDCGIVKTFTAVSMPAKLNDNPDSGRALEDGFFYCDSLMGKFGGQGCPEFTLMNANKHAYRIEGHVCTAINDAGHYQECDQYGNSAGAENPR